MKGVILAGGLGGRLFPLTKITNKHLLPIYDRPMVLYPLETLKRSGITDIMIVCGREHGGSFMNFLGSGSEYGVRLSYAFQDKGNGGIADALQYAEDFSKRESIAVILGDNIFDDEFSDEIVNFKRGAMVFLKESDEAKRFAVPVFDDYGKKILKIEEKPENPKSNLAQTGFYIFDWNVFDIIRKLKPSSRGELEIADVTNGYLERDELDHKIIQGFWSDAGTIDSLIKTSIRFYEHKKREYEKSKNHPSRKTAPLKKKHNTRAP